MHFFWSATTFGWKNLFGSDCLSDFRNVVSGIANQQDNTYLSTIYLSHKWQVTFDDLEDLEVLIPHHKTPIISI